MSEGVSFMQPFTQLIDAQVVTSVNEVDAAVQSTLPVAQAFFSGGIGTWEWVIILVIMLLLFGRRLPDVMRNLGSSAREFRKGLEDGKNAVDPNANKPAGSVSNDQQSAVSSAEPVAEPASTTPQTSPTQDRA